MSEVDFMMLMQNGKEFFMGLVLPFLVLYLTKIQWKAEYKLAAAVGASLAAGIVIAFADGKVTWETVGSNLAVIFTTAQVIYAMFFKALGLESVLFPQTAVVDKATTIVKEELSELSREDAVKILDPITSDHVTVNVETTIDP